MKNGDSRTQASTAKSDAALVSAAQAGDRKAFVEIVSRFQGMVTGVTLAVLGNFEAGEDAAQEAFVSAWKKIGTLKDPAKLRPWLTQIARNTAISHRRRQRPGEPLEDRFADEGPGPDELVASEDEKATVLAALEALPEKFRLPMVLFYREGESVRAVAEALELTEDVVKKRLAKGRELLRNRVARLVDSVVGRSVPSAMFTATVAGMIGALVQPSAIAATAFSASKVAEPIAATATVMTSSKLTLTTAALVAAVCIPIGYTTHKALASDRTAVVPPLVDDRPKVDFSDPSESEIVAEWRGLRERHGEGEGALAALHAEIETLPSELRRRAFRTLLATEWARIRPDEAFVFYREETRWELMRFLDEWVRVDADSAVDRLIGSGSEWEVSASLLLRAIALEAPDRLVEVVSLLPPKALYWVSGGFSVFARNDPAGARRAAEGLSGRRRKGAVEGIAEGWAEVDARSAFAWARSLADRQERNAAVRGVLDEWAKREPFAVLEHIGLSAPDDRIGRTVLGIAAEKDFDAALAWVREHPGMVNVEGMERAVGKRLAEDPVSLLERFESDGVLLLMLDALRSQEALTSDSGNARTALDWLFDPERSENAVAVRQHVIMAAPHSDAMRIVDRLPSGVERLALMGEVAKSVVDSWDDPFADLHVEDGVAQLLGRSSPEWRRALIEEGIMHHRSSEDPGAREWLAELPLTAEERAEFQPPVAP